VSRIQAATVSCRLQLLSPLFQRLVRIFADATNAKPLHEDKARRAVDVVDAVLRTDPDTLQPMDIR
jgi:hypothetical protein